MTTHGTTTAFVARARGARRVILADLNAGPAGEVGRPRPDEKVCGADGDIVEAILKLSGGRGADVVITASIKGGDARAIGDELQSLGCRIVELPGRLSGYVPGDGWSESRRPAGKPAPVTVPAPDPSLSDSELTSRIVGGDAADTRATDARRPTGRPPPARPADGPGWSSPRPRAERLRTREGEPGIVAGRRACSSPASDRQGGPARAPSTRRRMGRLGKALTN